MATKITTTTAAGDAHDVVVKLSFELIGVALMAIAADTNETLGTIILILMVSFLVYWFITKGATLLSKYTAPFQLKTTAVQ